jgi:ubiquinone/menaquinone biosynthesis C-methylase UbiE
VFEKRLLEVVQRGDRVLDVGCGSGKFFRADFARRIPCRWAGIDIRPAIRLNERVQLRSRADALHMPFADGTFDVAICRWMIEHVETPTLAFSELWRVLKPCGRLALFTPNLLHYYGMAAWLTPYRFHLWFNRQIRGFEDCDIFPTFYRANSQWRLRSLLREVGFSQIEVTAVEGSPAALQFSYALHRFGKLYERMVSRSDCLAAFRMNLIAVASK